jgi:hypothetical protein
MERLPPRTTSDEIDLYIRTYYSLLRSSGEVQVRAFEEAHLFSNSSLHLGARDPSPDVAAFAYSAARLPSCMPAVRRVVLGQSHEMFEAAGHDVQRWQRVRTRGRRRPLRWDLAGTLAAFVTSTSDIDDLVPIVTAWQIEWNKLHHCLQESDVGRRLAVGQPLAVDDAHLAQALRLDLAGLATLRAALGEGWEAGLGAIAARESNLSMRLLNGSFSQYQRAAQRWWGGVEPSYLSPAPVRRRPVYFVSSNTHCLVNLLGGYAHTHRDELCDFVRRHDPEGLRPTMERALADGDEPALLNLLYYVMRQFVDEPDPGDPHGRPRLYEVQRHDRRRGITSIESPGHIDVNAQVIELGQLVPGDLDPRLQHARTPELRGSDAVIINIDYPLGMAAYHHLSRLAQGVGELRGVYVMGKAATLNGRVGDVAISTVAHDEHTRNTYLFKNCFAAADVQPWLARATVLDNQKALTVRGPFLQNRDYMSVFYREGFTVLEMETGPYLSAIYENVYPNRHPADEIIHLSNMTPFDLGVLHYGSDTPYSRRQSLLSKSLSYFGVESTYGCALAIARRILERELGRLAL